MVSPRAVADIHSASACIETKALPSLVAESDYNHAEELRRLKQENMQLRRDLEDANNRIRQLEVAQRSTPSLFVPSSSYADSEDDYSVEISVTSSTTTVPMGSLSKNNESVQQKQQRDDEEETSSSVSDIIKTRGANYHRLSRQSRRHRNPFLQARPRKIPELRRLFSSESSESGLSVSSNEAVRSVSSSTIGNDVNISVGKNNDQVSSFAMNYFRRADSEDNSEASTDLRFEV